MSSSSVASHDTTATFYHVHPAPPPTVNALSARQKAQLRRSATKLAKMLGAAPQVVDSCTGPFRISLPLPLTSSKRMLQPTLAVSVEPSVHHHAHRRSRSASERVDPDLYPLSSALRPARRRHPSGSATSKRDSTSTSAAVLRHRRSLSAESDLPNTRNPTPVPVPTRTGACAGGSRPESTLSQASSCDSLFLSLSEPSFAIPSAARLRREKMARVCKILGEDVPVALVFPSEDQDEDGDEDDVDEKGEKRRSGYVRYSYVEAQTRPVSVIEIGAEMEKEMETEAPLPPPKPELHIQTRPRPRRVAPPRLEEEEEKKAPQPHPQPQQQPQQPKWTSPGYAHVTAYRTTCTPLEPIAEHSTRTSSSSFSSSSTVASASAPDSADDDDASSACSLLTNTTSSSYRFAGAASPSHSSSPTLHSSPPSSLDHASTLGGADSPPPPPPPTYDSLTTHSRREFAVYVPLQPFQRFRSAAARRSSGAGSVVRTPGLGDVNGAGAGAGGCAAATAAAEAEVKKARGVKFEMVVRPRPLPLPPVVDLRF